jgi:hypothetical protein
VLNANAFEHLRRAVVHPDRKRDVVLTHRRLQQGVSRSVEAKPIGDAIELCQSLAESGQWGCIGRVAIQRFG